MFSLKTRKNWKYQKVKGRHSKARGKVFEDICIAADADS